MASLFSVNADGSLSITLPPQLLLGKIPNGTLAQLPNAPGPGDTFVALDQPDGQNLYIGGADGKWTQMLNLGGSGGLQFQNGTLDINLSTMPMLERENTFKGLNHFQGDVDFTGNVTGLPLAAPKIWAAASSAIAQPVAAKIDATLGFETDDPDSTPGLHTSPSEFRIPAAGKYHGYAEIRSIPSGGAVYLSIRRNGQQIAMNGWSGGPGGGPSLQTVFARPLAEGDILTVVAASWSPFNVESASFVFET